MDAYITQLIEKAAETGIQRKQLQDIGKVKKKLKPKYLTEPIRFRYYLFLTGLIAVLITAGLPKYAFRRPIYYVTELFRNRVYDPNGNCLVNAGSFHSFEILRPKADCKFCRNVDKVPVSTNLTKTEFLTKYAYTGLPVLVKGGANNWTALETFSYQYFKKLYTEKNAIEEFDTKNCQFFGYKTNLHTLSHVFKMSKKRAALKKDQWYIGWSNCIEDVQNELRKHYSRPVFLPDDSESSSLDWIFMGGSGTGALMHIDAVNRPSWQAMIKGKKTWFIEPPPECELQCPKHLSATMEPGDILVIDTNKWFHSTFIFPGEMAITIGSEYD